MRVRASVVLVLLGVVAAALLPPVASASGASVFWSQCVGIWGGSLLLHFAIVRRGQSAYQTVATWAVVMTMAMLFVLAVHRVWPGAY